MSPVQNARYEAYQMRVCGQNYHTSAKRSSQEMLESMMHPEVRSRSLFLFVHSMFVNISTVRRIQLIK